MQSEQPTLSTGQFLVILCIVCVAAAIAAGLLGTIAPILYALPMDSNAKPIPDGLGQTLGTLSGVVAALFWCMVMRARIARHGQNRMILSGALYGGLAGIMSASLLHLGLSIVVTRVFLGALLVGEGFGLGGGIIVGMFAAHCVRCALPPVASPSQDAAIETES